MKKEDILKVLEEADKALGNYTDGQLRSHLTISKNRRPITEQTRKILSNNGKKLMQNKKGLFALSKEQRIQNSRLGSLNQSKEHKSAGGKIGGKAKKDIGKPILMFDKFTNEFIKEFTSIATAARFLNRNKTAENKIRRVANGDRKSSYGFIWKYKN